MNNRTLGTSLAMAAAVLFVCRFMAAAHAEPPLLIAEPPAPETLAKLLVPPRYRSADMEIDGTQAESGGGFGMLINFELNSAAISPESLPLLESVGKMFELPRVAGKVIVVAGHADARGSDAYNQALSERRANTIKEYLVESFGIEPNRLMTVGYGEYQPYDRADPLNGINRRVEFSAAAGISIQ